MLQGQRLRLLRRLAALLLFSATFALPAVSHGSVVDQYTEERPTPGGGVPTGPSGARPGSGGEAENSPDAFGGIFDTIYGTAPPLNGFDPESGEFDAGSRSPATSEEAALDSAATESSGTPGGMGSLFPILLLLTLMASVGYAIRRGSSLSGRQGSR